MSVEEEADNPEHDPRQFYVGHGKVSYEETTTTTTTTTTTATEAATATDALADPTSSSTSDDGVQFAAHEETTTTVASAATTEVANQVTDQAFYPMESASNSEAHVADDDWPATAEQTSSEDDPLFVDAQPPPDNDNHFESEHMSPAHATDAAQRPQKLESRLRAIDRASTSYALFSSNPYRFSTDNIHASTHYLTDKIEGRIWLDSNGDGRRGDRASPELMDVEFDTGIGGVQVRLINCETDEPVMDPVKSRPLGSYGGNPVVRQSEFESAGLYSFPIGKMSAGRYYLMYTAPRDYRISGNVLPLEREIPYFDCVPRGGEGDVYLREGRTKGDFDVEGYCARSIGCFEVDDMTNVHEKSNFDDYSKLEVLDNEALSDKMKEDYHIYMGNLVAIPSAEYFNVGLAEEEWELPTYQYTDLEVTLTLPPDVDPERVVPQGFERSDARRRLEEGLTLFLGGKRIGGDVFDLRGVDVLRGKIEQVSTRKMLRGLSAPKLLNKVTYALTARGRYRPPPYQQLGSFIEDSINADPQGVAKSLEDVEALNEVIAEDVNAKWLTIKEPKPTKEPMELATLILEEERFVFVGSWAFFLAIGLAAFICICLLCAGTCLCARARLKAKAATAEDIPKEVNSMEDADIRQELESYGVSTSCMVGRQKLVDTLIQARFDKLYSRPAPKKKVTFSFTTIFSSFSSASANTNPSQSTWTQSAEAVKQDFEKHELTQEDKQRRMKEMIKSCESLKVRELKTMLKSLGVSSSGFVERKEMVRALAKARVNSMMEDDATARATDDEESAKRNKKQNRRSFSNQPMQHGRTGVRRGSSTSPRKSGAHQSTSPSPGRGETNDNNAHSSSRQRGGTPSPGRGKKSPQSQEDNRHHRRSPSATRGSYPSHSARPRSNERSSSHRSTRPCSNERNAHGTQAHSIGTKSEEFPGCPHSKERQGHKPQSSDGPPRSRSDPQDYYRFAKTRRRSEEYSARPRVHPSARRTRSAENQHPRPRSEERRKPSSKEQRAAQSCPNNPYATAWNEAQYYSQFAPSGNRNTAKENRTNSRMPVRPRSEERQEEVKAYPRPRRRTVEHLGGPYSRDDFKRSADRKAPSGNRNTAKENHTNSRMPVRPRSEERQKEVKAYPRPRRRTVEHPGGPYSRNDFKRSADRKPRQPKGFRRKKTESARRFVGPSANGVEDLFNDDFSTFDIGSHDPPETERTTSNRPPQNDPFMMGFPPSRPAEPWMMC